MLVQKRNSILSLGNSLTTYAYLAIMGFVRGGLGQR